MRRPERRCVPSSTTLRCSGSTLRSVTVPRLGAARLHVDSARMDS